MKVGFLGSIPIIFDYLCISQGSKSSIYPTIYSRSIDKMAYIVQKRDYDHQMKSLFHHSLIKIIVLHHLNQLNIAWDNFIANEIFTVPPTPHAQDMPSSSHPTIIIHSSISAHTSIHLHLISHPHHHRHHHHFMIMQGHLAELKVIKPKRADLSTLAHTYQRGHRKVFSPQIVGGALPSSSTK